ncbi:MAG: LruC domain-containing protein, partial [Myxococcales bacterium]|nr:LruC domain-containing protein [Myxococcales bacterium]
MRRHGIALALALLAPRAASATFDTDCDIVPDEIDTYPCDPSVSATGFAPAQGDHGMLLFKDQFPSQGDFDFNDVAVTYNYVFRMDRFGKVASFRVTFNVLAVGGTYHNGLGLRIPMLAREIRRATRTVAGQVTRLTPSALDADATFVVSDDLRELFARPEELINADPTLPRQIGDVIEVEVEFDQPRVFSLAAAPYDVFIFRTVDPSIEVHSPEYRGTARMDTSLFGTQDDRSDGTRNFVDTRGIPFALRFPTVVAYPLEAVSIDLLYPNIVAFGQSGGTLHQDFYTSLPQSQYAYRDSAGQAAPTPGFVATNDLPADTSCVPAWGLAVQWGTRRSIFTYGAKLADNGDALVTGYTRGDFPAGPNLGGLDAFISRYDTVTGNENWATQIGTSGDDTGRDLVTDAAGNIYVTGAKSNAASWGPWHNGQLAGLSDG